MTRAGVLPLVTGLFSGMALRCRQTAELLFPNQPYQLCPMTEIGFGVFKGKNAGDLLGDPDYGRWLDTGCMGDIPGGGSVTGFKARCCEIFQNIAGANDSETIAMVIHGGNIMAILERFALPKRDFYEYHVPNLGFFLCQWDNGILTIEGRGSL